MRRDGDPPQRKFGKEDHDPVQDPSSGTQDDITPSSSGPTSPMEWLTWFWETEKTSVVITREVIVSVGIVLLIGFLLFSLSGIWPPMVAIESGSMEPHMSRHDLVFITAPDRFAHDGAIAGTGVLPYDRAENVDYVKFGSYGDVIVFQPNGEGDRIPIIHRAHLWVDEDEDWYDRADPDRIGDARNCDQLNNCPAPHDGFITLGDANQVYDQVQGQSEPVKAEWIVGTANVRIPYLGWIRLTLSEHGIVSVITFEFEQSIGDWTSNTSSILIIDPSEPVLAVAPIYRPVNYRL